MGRVNLSILILSIISVIIFPFWIIQFISIFIILIYTLSFLLSKSSFSAIEFRQENIIYHCKNNSEEHINLCLWNKSFLPLFNVNVKFRGNGLLKNGNENFLVSLQKHEELKIESELITTSRGVYSIGPIVVSGSDFFNFFPWNRTLEFYYKIIIYPKFHNIELLLLNGESGGSQKVNNPIHEDLSDLKSIREYRVGDSLKRINWKASAKSGQLQTMEFSCRISSPLFIIMDLNPLNYPIKNRYTYLERSIEVAASLVSSYTEKSEGCGLLTQDKSSTLLIPQNKGYINSVAIMESLANIEFGNTDCSILDEFIKNRVNIQSGSHLYFILPTVDKNIEKLLCFLKKSNYTIKIINTGGVTNCSIDSKFEVLHLTSYGQEFFN